VIQFLLDISNGSLRILLNYLEKIKLFGAPIDIDLAVQLCTNISFHTLSAYTCACQNSNIPEAVQCIVSWLKNGYSGIDILDNYFVFLKHTKDISEDHKSKLVPCICKYITIFYTVHEDDIELFFFTNNVITIFNLE
jgi:DNA polymerase III gamma/tau subunit